MHRREPVPPPRRAAVQKHAPNRRRIPPAAALGGDALGVQRVRELFSRYWRTWSLVVSAPTLRELERHLELICRYSVVGQLSKLDHVRRAGVVDAAESFGVGGSLLDCEPAPLPPMWPRCQRSSRRRPTPSPPASRLC